MLGKGTEVPRGGHQWETAARIIGKGLGKKYYAWRQGLTKPGSGNKDMDISGQEAGAQSSLLPSPIFIWFASCDSRCFSKRKPGASRVTCKVAAEWK